MHSTVVSIRIDLDYSLHYSKFDFQKTIKKLCFASRGERVTAQLTGSNLGSVKLDTVMPTARHLCDISSKEAVLPTAQ